MRTKILKGEKHTKRNKSRTTEMNETDIDHKFSQKEKSG